MKLSLLIGQWINKKGHIWIIRKTLDKSNTLLDIQFKTLIKYPEPFGFNSDIFENVEQWHRFDSKSFDDVIQKEQLKKLETVI